MALPERPLTLQDYLQSHIKISLTKLFICFTSSSWWEWLPKVQYNFEISKKIVESRKKVENNNNTDLVLDTAQSLH